MRDFLVIVFVLIVFPLFGQYDGEVHSVQFYPKGNLLGEPLIQLNSGNSLILEFDVLGEDAPLLSYTIQHCTYDWGKSRISPFEYVKGFSTATLTNYDFSFDTEQYYVHFEEEYPNRNSQLLISGNYKLIVYENSPSEPLFEQRFMVTEQLTPVLGQVTNAPGVGKRETSHQLNFNVRYKGLRASNPREEFKVNILQNNRTDNALMDIKPARYNQEELFYSNPFKQIFEAGNQFRWFNTRSFRYKTQGVAEYLSKSDGTHAYLIPDQVRKDKRYIPYQDFNGKFKIEHQEGKETPALEGKDIYLFGALTNWEIDDRYKLEFDPKQKLLKTTQYLKQGNYDYTYLTSDGDGYSMGPTEGNNFRTENQYTIYVYYSPFSARYDRLVGITQLDSRFN